MVDLTQIPNILNFQVIPYNIGAIRKNYWPEFVYYIYRLQRSILQAIIMHCFKNPFVLDGVFLN